MATITIKIDERNKAAKGFIEMLKHLSFVKITEEVHTQADFNEETKKAVEDAENGKITKITLSDFRKQLAVNVAKQTAEIKTFKFYEKNIFLIDFYVYLDNFLRPKLYIRRIEKEIQS